MCQQCENPEVNETIIDRIDDIEMPIAVCTDCFDQFNAECDAEEKAAAEKLELAKKIVATIEMGGLVHITLHSFKTGYNKQMAERTARGLGEAFGLPYEVNSNAYEWFDLRDYGNPVNITVHYNETKEDEIARLEKKLQQLRESESHEHSA